MSELFDKWEDDIKKYCEINNLSFEKAKNMAKCWGKDDLIYNNMIVSKIMEKVLMVKTGERRVGKKGKIGG